MSRLFALLALVLVAGCGSPAAAAPPAPEVVVQASPVPVAVDIPDIGAQSSLVPLGLDAEGALAVPPVDQPEQAGWFEPGVRPGDPGPAVIAAHVNGRRDGVSLPGVFARLHELQPGALIHVARADGSSVMFRVERVEHHDKDAFPTAAVYGDVPGAELRLITCGGAFDEAAHSYEDNVVVFAVLVS